MTDSSTARHTLTEHKRVAIVGLSADQSRPSHSVAAYELEHGFEAIPINPAYDEAVGKKAAPDLDSVPVPVEIVTCSGERSISRRSSMPRSRSTPGRSGCSWVSSMQKRPGTRAKRASRLSWTVESRSSTRA